MNSRSKTLRRASLALAAGAGALAISACGSSSVVVTHTVTVPPANSTPSTGNSGNSGTGDTGNSGTADTGTGTLETVTAEPVQTVTETVATQATVTVAGNTGPSLADTPQFTTDNYTGREPTSVGISQDGGDIVTDLKWASWGTETATGNGTSDVQNCVPNCAQGTDTPVPTTLVFSDPSGGYFTKLTEYRQHQTTVYNYTPGGATDNWPPDAG